ncbi:DUF3499 domain-containing protein [Streptomyces alkaliphilus]|uniref:DUF3499 domain-containing protein n=1 Tax=Streptomyces alkaliphilus TaxID=1472722 RepID=UPI00117F9236|nr:DUF3499 domain-containing protein [Streptomyces alkaliphilus]MQS07603.1 DUF3499 family protein [Streptomyces alkaliphilus]
MRRDPLRSAVRSNIVSPVRRCSRTACGRPAVATLTYVYADSTAVLGPLATYAEPHCYDLCAEHSERLTAPRGWEVVRLAPDPRAPRPVGDDLEALADAVREAAGPPRQASPEERGRGRERDRDQDRERERSRERGRDRSGRSPSRGTGEPTEVVRRGHLRVLRSPDP